LEKGIPKKATLSGEIMVGRAKVRNFKAKEEVE
jgi:hypothetical protein